MDVVYIAITNRFEVIHYSIQIIAACVLLGPAPILGGAFCGSLRKATGVFREASPLHSVDGQNPAPSAMAEHL